VLPDPVGIVPLASITAPQISAYNLAVPTYPEQIAIAAVLTDMDVELTALERRRGKTRALKQALLLRTGAAAFLC
jgi:type I restriction enzyme, S subunit